MLSPSTYTSNTEQENHDPMKAPTNANANLDAEEPLGHLSADSSDEDDNDATPQETPLPRGFGLTVLLIQISQGIYIQMPFTMLVYMVEDFKHLGPGESEEQVGRLTGYLASLNSFGVLLGAIPWGWVSDRCGRKPVMLLGLLNAGLSLLALGLSRSYLAACLARFLGGLGMGVLAALKTTIGEVCDETNQPRAMSYLSMGWGLGGVLGPIMGGALSNPCAPTGLLAPSSPPSPPSPSSSSPSLIASPPSPSALPLGSALCGAGSPLVHFPYLLPTLVAALSCAVSLALSAVFVQETLASRKQVGSATYTQLGESDEDEVGAARRGEEGGLELVALEGGPSERRLAPDTHADVVVAIDTSCDRVEERDRCTNPTAPSPLAGKGAAQSGGEGGETEAPWWRNQDCVRCLAGYAGIAFSFIILDEAIPIYTAASRGAGGLEMASGELAKVLGFGGAALFAYTMLLYPRVAAALGLRRALLCSLAVLPLPDLLIPAVSLLPPQCRCVGAALALANALKNVGGTTAFTSAIIMINHAAPPERMGVVNGAASMVASLVRGVGPASAGVIWAASLESRMPLHQFVVFAFSALCIVIVIVVYLPVSTVGAKMKRSSSKRKLMRSESCHFAGSRLRDLPDE